jgi:hypothetical protein
MAVSASQGLAEFPLVIFLMGLVVAVSLGAGKYACAAAAAMVLVVTPMLMSAVNNEFVVVTKTADKDASGHEPAGAADATPAQTARPEVSHNELSDVRDVTVRASRRIPRRSTTRYERERNGVKKRKGCDLEGATSKARRLQFVEQSHVADQKRAANADRIAASEAAASEHQVAHSNVAVGEVRHYELPGARNVAD